MDGATDVKLEGSSDCQGVPEADDHIDVQEKAESTSSAGSIVPQSQSKDNSLLEMADAEPNTSVTKCDDESNAEIRKAKIVGMLKGLSKYKDCEENFDDMFRIGSPKKNTRQSKSPRNKEDRNSSLHEFLDSELPFIKSMGEAPDVSEEGPVSGEIPSLSESGIVHIEDTSASQKKAKKKKNKGKEDFMSNSKDKLQSLGKNEMQVPAKAELNRNDVTDSDLPGSKKSKKQKNKQKNQEKPHEKGPHVKQKKNFESSSDDEELNDSKVTGSYSQLLKKLGKPYKGQKQTPSPNKQKVQVHVDQVDERRFVPISSSPLSDEGFQKQKKKNKNKSPDNKQVDNGQRPNSASKRSKERKQKETKMEQQVQQLPSPEPVVQTEMKVQLPKEEHRYIVGPAGRHITDIFHMTGVTIDVPPLNSSSEEIILRGDQLQLGPAVAIMFSKSQQLRMGMMQKQGARPKEGGQALSQGNVKGQQPDTRQSPKQSGKKQLNVTGPREFEQPQPQRMYPEPQPQRMYPGQFVRQNSNRSQGSISPRGGKFCPSPSDQQGQYVRGQQQKGVKGQKQKYLEGQGQRSDARCKTPERGPGQGSTPKSQGKRQRNKKFQFADYISDKDLSDGLKRGTLIQGSIRINPKNFEEAYVPHPDGRSDVMIESLKDRNRALNGDVVAIQICDEGDWKLNKQELQTLEHSFQSKLQLEAGEAEGDDADIVIESEELVEIVAEQHTPPTNAESLQENGSPAGKSKKKCEKREPPKKRFTSVNEVMTGGSPIAKKMLVEEGKGVAKHLIQRTGKVVAIIEKKHSRASTGFIKPLPDKGDKALFVSNDYRFPRTYVPLSCCPKDFYERPEDHQRTLYVCRITDWRQDSVYADGILAKSLGEAGEIEPETEGMLIENGVDFDPFPQEALDCLPQQLPWVIPEQEFEYRRDFRSDCVFTIDPLTARDLDDALSCEDLGNGRYKVGVHIADVSYFLHEGNILDKVAALRSTSVYLVHKVIPMLPRLLCEQLCSLNPNEDRLTFSVEWLITEDGEIEEEWFGRSVIRSCTKLAYEHAQGFIEQPDREWTAEELPPISEKFSIPEIKTRVLNLHKIAMNLRKARHDGGALRLDQLKLQYSLDTDSGMPNGYSVYQQKDSNKLVEEFMLLANMAVAHRINGKYPDKAFLRRHPPPQEKMIDTLKEQCEALGIFIDTSSAGGIQRSLRNYSGDDEYAAARMQVLTALCSKPMQNAVYFCTGCLDDESEYRHYALNVPLYTHFTSPIRRYPDVIVHRLLGATLDYGDPPVDSPQTLERLAKHCNDKKTNAKRVGDLSCELFFAVFIKTAGPLEEKAMVMGVLDKAFDIFVLKLGVSKRVYCDKLPLREKVFRKERKVPSLVLVWNTEPGEPVLQQEITIFSVVDCVLQAGDQPLQWMAVIKPPAPQTY